MTPAIIATSALALATVSAPVADYGVFSIGPETGRLIVIFFASCLTNNIALAYFIGMCAFLALSKNVRVAFGMGVAVTCVTGLTAMVNWLINHFVLLPLGLEFLQFLVFIIVIAAIVQFLELVIDRFFPALYEAFGIYLPLITVNCTVLAASLFMVFRQYGFWQTTVFAFGTGVGWLFAILLLASIRQHLVFSRPVRQLGDVGMALLIAGLMAMAFSGFSGMVKL